MASLLRAVKFLLGCGSLVSEWYAQVILTMEITYQKVAITLFSSFGISWQCFAIGKIALWEIVC